MSITFSSTTAMLLLGLFAFLVLGIPLLASARHFYRAWKQYRWAKQSARWAVTTGTITHAALREEKHTPDDDSAPFYTYHPEIRYTYIAEGKTHEGSRVQFGGFPDFTQAEAQEILAQYPVGAQVTVYYDPDQPTNAVLVVEQMAPYEIVRGCGILLILFLIIIVLLLNGLHISP